MDSHVNPRHIGEFLSKNARHRLTLFVLEKMKVKPVGKGVKADPRGRPRGKKSVLADMLVVKQRTVHRWLDPDGVQANDSNATELAHIAVQYDYTETAKILLNDLAEHKKAVDTWIKNMNKIDEVSD